MNITKAGEKEVVSLAYIESDYGRSSTKSNYLSGVKTFLKEMYGEKDLALADRYLAEVKGGRNVEDDIKAFLESLRGKPPTSISMYMTGVRVFLMKNEIDVKEKIARARIPSNAS
jgi:hypothetical protein